MPKREFSHPHDLREMVGQEVVVTDWLEITQERINQFADATGDHQWIHIDVERAAKESPYRTTIAHGFLTLSLVSCFMSQAIAFNEGLKFAINYGLNRVRFTAAVPAGSLLRARIALQSLEDIDGGVQACWAITGERQSSDKPVCVVEWLVRYYI